MNQPTETRLVQCSIPMMLPAVIELPVQTNEHGQPCPCNGLIQQRFLSHEDLELAGVQVVWRDESGAEVSREAAVAAIERMREEAMKAAASSKHVVLQA